MKKSELRQIIREEIQILNEKAGKALRVVSYSKAKDLKSFQRILNKSPKNPPIDMALFINPSGAVGTPEEYRDTYGWTQLVVLGPKDNYRIVIEYTNGK